jgi:riboflavin kinase/FMN adenylyltransferase
MNIHFGFAAWDTASVGPAAATLGNFDGVHLGHQRILRSLVETSQKFSLPAVVITFDPVPRKILTPETAPPLIQTLEQRLECLERLDIHHTIVVAFDQEFAKKSPQDFVRQYLVEVLSVKAFVVGENFAFGHRKSGDLTLLRALGSQYGFSVENIPEVRSGGVRVSSTLIRQRIVEGNVAAASRLLDRPFALRGTVVEGERIGSRIGIPTANLSVENELIPGRGVYACRAAIDSGSYPAATNVGIRPTIGGNRMIVEAHLIGFSNNLYGQRMELQFFDRIRDEQKFNNIEELKAQILADIQTVRSRFS